MKTRRLWTGLLLVITLIATVAFMFGCSSPAATTPATPSTPSTPSAPAAKTLKIALNLALNWPIGLDNQHAVQLEVENINSKGGLQIGPDKYKLEVLFDDNKMDSALGKTAAQKEIFQDGVKFIASDNFASSFLSLCDDNKVLLFSHPASMEDYNPKYKYLVHGCINNTTFISMIAYGHQKFPNLKTFVGVLPDREDGRTYGKVFTEAAKNVGLQPLEMVYYPPTATDLSAVGTKIKSLNPDILIPYGGGPQLDSLAGKAAYGAGWRGQLLGSATIPGQVMLDIGGAEAMNNMVAWAWPAEFDPALTPEAADFKARYTAKFGKWDNPETINVCEWYTMMAGLQQAGSIDVDKVAAKIFGGMKFDCPNGSFMMIPRGDYNNTKTIDQVVNLPAKLLKDGKVSLYDKTTPDQIFGYVKAMYKY